MEALGQSSLAAESFVLKIELHKLLTHHVQLSVVVLFYDLLFGLSRLKLSLEFFLRLLFFVEHLVVFVFPLPVLFHDLQAASFREPIDTVHLVSHLANLLQ